MEQTAYCVELFDFLDNVVGATRQRAHEESMNAVKNSK